MKSFSISLLMILGAFFSLAHVLPASAQSEGDSLEDPEPVIAMTVDPKQADISIRDRIVNIFQVIESLDAVEVSVKEGVVTLAGDVANEADASQAQQLAIRIEGVVTVRDNMNRTLGLSDNVLPALESAASTGREVLKALPLIGVAILIAVVIAFLGVFLARRQGLIKTIAPNTFLAELLSQAIRVGAIVAGVIVALNLLGAGGMVTTLVGGAGVLGLAVGFAVRDSMENYISSIMLSLRQPFRAKDHVIVNDHEGIVVRLTSRATILMTMDGNHLRIPNSEVFKGTILNFSTNPERRFDFELGVDAEDDPIAGMKAGVEAITALPFVLNEPEASSLIVKVGDSNIVLRFYGWVDQRETSFGKARSLAIRAAIRALEEGGFTLPEPIYRLRFDEALNLPAVVSVSKEKSETSDAPRRQVGDPQTKIEQESVEKPRPKLDEEDMDVSPDEHLSKKVDEEIREDPANDLLDDSTPRE